MKSRRMGWTGHVEGIENRRSADRVMMGRSAGRDRLKDPGVD
jgi:hypothetical protein